MEDVEFPELKLPSMRKELVDYLQGLSDREYQYQAWVNNRRIGGGHDELDYAVHFLYDDTNLARDPISTVGWILKNNDEVDLISDLVRQLDHIFDKYGLDLTDKEYIETMEWEAVIKSAAAAKKHLEINS